jgi:hypothetical protein
MSLPLLPLCSLILQTEVLIRNRGGAKFCYCERRTHKGILPEYTIRECTAWVPVMQGGKALSLSIVN